MKHEFQKRIYGYECDIYGHLNNANYLQIFEAARTEFLILTDLSIERLSRMGISIFISETLIKYKKPVELNDIIKVVSMVKSCSRVKSVWKQEIYNENNELCTVLEIQGVFVMNGKPARIPKEFHAVYLQYVTSDD